MATDKTKPKNGTPSSGSEVFQEFQKAVLSFVDVVPNAALKLLGNDPAVNLVKSNAVMVQNIFKNSFTKMNNELAGVNTLVASEAMEFLEITDGIGFARRSEETAVQAFQAKLFGGNIWQWLGQNLTEIKKIIRMILGIFSKKLADWWESLEVLIDEIWDLIMSLLGGLFGFNSREIAGDLSYAQVNYLNEMTALARLKQVTKSSDDFDEG